MKLKNKFYLIQLLTMFALILLGSVMYLSFHQQSHENLENELQKSVDVTTLLLRSALEDTYRIFEQKKSLFTRIHRTALAEFKKDETIPLEQLKHKMMTLFHLKDLDFDLDFFVIDNNYVIIDATLKKDIGIDFKNERGVKAYLDTVAKDQEIHLDKGVYIDYMDSSFKSYSCASTSHDKYLQMAFVDYYRYQKLSQSVSDIAGSTGNKIGLFQITKTTYHEEYYEDILNNEEVTSKAKVWREVKKFPLDSTTDDNIINAHRQNKIIRTDENAKGDKVSFYIPLSIRENEGSLHYKYSIMKLEIDISGHLNEWRKNKMIFILLGIAMLLLMLIWSYFIKNYFYIPITKITQNLEDEVEISDPDLLMKKDEFGTLAHKYNTLYANLQHQIEHNQQLLQEKKQFIADMVHQIRTPLTVIMTNTSLIDMKSEAGVSPYITQINSAINMLSNSYEDLSYIISHDSIEYKAIEIDLAKFLNERIDFFEVIAQANHKTIRTTITSEIRVTMNDIELERLIDNNISNAIKHSSEKSEIEIVLEKNDTEVVLKFISKGKNIKDASRVFDKNYTENHSAKRSLGLGLNMVKSICEKNSILYSAHSEENTNTFTYIFKPTYTPEL